MTPVDQQVDAGQRRASAARWPSWVSKKNPIKSGVDIEKLQNARPVAWVQERPDQPLVFPLKGDNANTHSGHTIQSSGSHQSSDQQPKPVDGGSHDASSSTQKVNDGRLIYEQVFNYPAQDRRAPQSRGSPSQAPGGHGQGSQRHQQLKQSLMEGGRPFHLSRLISPRQSGYEPHEGKFAWQQMRFIPEQVPQKPTTEAHAPAPPPPPKYIIQSTNGFQRYRKTYRMSKYSPDFDAPQPELKEFGPVFQPATSKYFKDPRWYSHTMTNEFEWTLEWLNVCLLGSRHKWLGCGIGFSGKCQEVSQLVCQMLMCDFLAGRCACSKTINFKCEYLPASSTNYKSWYEVWQTL